jgi:hypothetical protein
MKTKIKCLNLLALTAAFCWGTWTFAYYRGFTQGYSEGTRDEYHCWEQEPTRADRSWDHKVTGRRDMHKLLGGKSVPQVALTPTFELDTQTGKVIQKK